jgi:PIN domain nuclease of toxin-antitoxin system
MTVVLDASALLALVAHEPGWETVDAALDGAIMSAVNLAEAFAKLEERRYGLDRARANVAASGIEIVRFDEAAAVETARLRPMTRRQGLSLGDRACLALAAERKLPVLTTDRAWAALDLGLDVRVVR